MTADERQQQFDAAQAELQAAHATLAQPRRDAATAEVDRLK